MRESEEIEMQIRQISKKCLYRTTDFALEEMILLYQSKTHSEKWSSIKKSSYIESLIISYPLESFLLLENKNSDIIIDGNEKHIHGKSTIQKLSDGTATWDGLLLDITTQKKSDYQLKEMTLLVLFILQVHREILKELF